MNGVADSLWTNTLSNIPEDPFINICLVIPLPREDGYYTQSALLMPILHRIQHMWRVQEVITFEQNKQTGFVWQQNDKSTWVLSDAKLLTVIVFYHRNVYKCNMQHIHVTATRVFESPTYLLLILLEMAR